MEAIIKGHKVTYDETIEKPCNNCTNVKPLSEFGKNKSAKDGMQYWCKFCISDYGKTRTKERQEAKEAPPIEEGFVSKDDTPSKVIERMKPIYDYLNSLITSKDGIITMPKSVPEIVDFYTLKPRIGIDLLYKFIKLEDNGYTWLNKPKTAREVAKAYLSILKIPKKNPNITLEVMYEHVLLMHEEMYEISSTLSRVSNTLEQYMSA